MDDNPLVSLQMSQSGCMGLYSYTVLASDGGLFTSDGDLKVWKDPGLSEMKLESIKHSFQKHGPTCLKFSLVNKCLQIFFYKPLVKSQSVNFKNPKECISSLTDTIVEHK